MVLEESLIMTFAEGLFFRLCYQYWTDKYTLALYINIAYFDCFNDDRFLIYCVSLRVFYNQLKILTAILGAIFVLIISLSLKIMVQN